MFLILRLVAYGLSSFALWQVVSGGSGLTGAFPHPAKVLAIDQEHGMILGVCAGLSNYIGIDVTVIRLIWALTVLYRGIGLAIYILAFLIMPSQSI